ncbi:MAG: GNAT family N-acetyltransferase [Lachnospiraceae bacterium]|nr:GNAT family N-acetyltransferase [Lachnospiraceae bacterium]
MKHSYSAGVQNVRLRPLEERDIESLRIWRNDPEKTAFLRRIGEITPDMQKKWFEAYLENPDEITFAIEETQELHRLVGSVALYNFKDGAAEAGKIQIGDDEAHGRGIAAKSMALAACIGFHYFGLEKIAASVHQENAAAYRSYLKIGFRAVGSHEAPMGGREDELELTVRQLRGAVDYLQEIYFYSGTEPE